MRKAGIIALTIVFLLLVGCVSSIEKQEKSNENYVCIPKSALQKGGILNISEIENVINPTNDQKKPAMIEAANTTTQTTNTIANNNSSQTPPQTNQSTQTTQPKEQPKQELIATKKFIEGDVVQLTPKGTDADGDPLQFTFTKPLDKNGRWQTKAGDAGEYIINVTASDGKSVVTKQAKIIIERLNLAPIIKIDDTVVVKEGDTFELNPKVSDPEGKEIKVYYSGWMDTAKKTTTFTDSGNYIVTITASDGERSSFKNITIVVKNTNRAPIMTGLTDITAKETELIKLKPTVVDPDGENITLNFSKPFDQKGEWQTKKGDAGINEIKVTASDGTDIVSQRIKVTITKLNFPPTLQKIDAMLVQVGDTVTLNPIFSDPDGNKVTVTFSGWMTTATKKTTATDTGKHTVTITADDGEEKTIMDVQIEVNSPPEFVI